MMLLPENPALGVIRDRQPHLTAFDVCIQTTWLEGFFVGLWVLSLSDAQFALRRP